MDLESRPKHSQSNALRLTAGCMRRHAGSRVFGHVAVKLGIWSIAYETSNGRMSLIYVMQKEVKAEPWWSGGEWHHSLSIVHRFVPKGAVQLRLYSRRLLSMWCEDMCTKVAVEYYMEQMGTANISEISVIWLYEKTICSSISLFVSSRLIFLSKSLELKSYVGLKCVNLHSEGSVRSATLQGLRARLDKLCDVRT